MSELRQRRGDGDNNEKVETAGESDHVLILNYIFKNQFCSLLCHKCNFGVGS